MTRGKSVYTGLCLGRRTQKERSSRPPMKLSLTWACVVESSDMFIDSTEKAHSWNTQHLTWTYKNLKNSYRLAKNSLDLLAPISWIMESRMITSAVVLGGVACWRSSTVNVRPKCEGQQYMPNAGLMIGLAFTEGELLHDGSFFSTWSFEVHIYCTCLLLLWMVCISQTPKTCTYSKNSWCYLKGCPELLYTVCSY